MGECHYRSGNYEVINKIRLVHDILERLRIKPERLNLKWVSAAEAPRFVEVITEFGDRIKTLGHMGETEGVERGILDVRLKAAKLAMESKKLRLIFAKQADYMKVGDSYRELPDDHKLSTQLRSVLSDEIAKQVLRLCLEEKPRSVEELSVFMDVSSENVERYVAELEKKDLIDRDKIILS